MMNKLWRAGLTPLYLLLLLLSVGCRAEAQPQVTKDVVYGEVEGQKLLLDVYTATPIAAKMPPLPALLLVHGGSWVSGSKADMADIGHRLSLQGFVCFAVNYRLVKPDANKYPACYDDVQRAVRWVRAHAGEYGVDKNRVGAVGFSAGGHLVALLGTTDTRDNSDAALAAYSSRVECVVDFFGPTDFTLALPPNQLEDSKAYRAVANLLGKMPNEAPDLYRAASPITHIDARTVPFLIFHGDRDNVVPLDQSERFERALKAQKLDSKLIVLPGEGHGFSNTKNLQLVFLETFDFLNRNLKPVK